MLLTTKIEYWIQALTFAMNMNWRFYNSVHNDSYHSVSTFAASCDHVFLLHLHHCGSLLLRLDTLWWPALIRHRVLYLCSHTIKRSMSLQISSPLGIQPEFTAEHWSLKKEIVEHSYCYSIQKIYLISLSSIKIQCTRNILWAITEILRHFGRNLTYALHSLIHNQT